MSMILQAELHVSLASNGSVALKLTGLGTPLEIKISRPSFLKALAVGRKIRQSDLVIGTKLRSKLIDEFVLHLIPDSMDRLIRQWVLQAGPLGSEPNDYPQQRIDSPVLWVSGNSPDVAELPWEVLSEAMNLNFLVTRLSAPGPEPVKRASWPLRMLVAGWTRFPGLDHGFPGIERELNSLSAFSGLMAVEVLSNATWDQLAAAMTNSEPDVLHLSLAGVSDLGRLPAIYLPTAGKAVPELTSADLISQRLTVLPRPQLIVLNACSTGPHLARILSESLGITTFGWAGNVDDQLAADFSLFFYQRLVEGSPPILAIDNFLRRDSINTKDYFSPLPMIWHPEKSALDSWPPPPSTAKGDDSSSQEIESWSKVSFAATIELQPIVALNPALLRNGRGALERLNLVNNSDQPIENLRLEITCDAGGNSSVVRQTMSLKPGSNPVETKRVEFPVLYELIAQKAGRRYVNFVVTASVGDVVIAESTSSALWMGLQEWMDQSETWAYIPAFVQCDNPGVRKVIDQAIKTLRTVGSPNDSFDGYQSGDPRAVKRQIKAIFQTLRDEPFKLAYISPPSGPVYIPGSSNAAGQRVRFPDEIVEHKRGTCHDLALLMASCAEHVGIHPLVVLIPGHTFFGYWTNEEEYRLFWAGHGNVVRTTSGDANWTINQVSDLNMLCKTASIVLVEAMAVTDHNSSFEAACQKGRRYIVNRAQHEFDVAIDVWASRYSVQPI